MENNTKGASTEGEIGNNTNVEQPGGNANVQKLSELSDDTKVEDSEVTVQNGIENRDRQPDNLNVICCAAVTNDDDEYYTLDNSSHTASSACDDGRMTPTPNHLERHQAAKHHCQFRKAAIDTAALAIAQGLPAT